MFNNLPDLRPMFRISVAKRLKAIAFIHGKRDSSGCFNSLTTKKSFGNIKCCLVND